MTLETLTEQIKTQISDAPTMGKSIKLQLKDGGFIHMDLTGDEPVVTNEDKDADCTVITTTDTLLGLKNGTVKPMAAMFTGKLKIKGDLSVATKLQTLFS